jgi:DNA-binding beta-propeller fold protein YncE
MSTATPPQVSTLTAGPLSYTWIDNWARLPDTPIHRENGRTHGVAVTAAGDVVVFCQASPAVLIFDSSGQLKRSWGERFLGAHGLTLTHENGADFLWLTDQGTAEVVKTDLNGKTVLTLRRPDLPIYHEGGYSPTWVAVNEERFGGNGDIWVTDGYGKNHIHRFDKSGRYIASINGEEGQAGAFKCPHGIDFDYRRGAPELYIADRSNRRIQVYDAEGKFKRTFGQDILTSPCGFATSGQYLLIPELRARLAILDGDDRLVGYLGSNEAVCDMPGWPNHRKELIQPGKFNSPHGMTADPKGNLYVVEWIIGGRITKLVRA